jgi:hypothetical protein
VIRWWNAGRLFAECAAWRRAHRAALTLEMRSPCGTVRSADDFARFGIVGRVVLPIALLLLVGCASPAPRSPALISAPIHATQPRPQHCMRPPPESPPMTGDEDVDRHRRDWHRERLITWADLAFEACRP